MRAREISAVVRVWGRARRPIRDRCANRAPVSSVIASLFRKRGPNPVLHGHQIARNHFRQFDPRYRQSEPAAASRRQSSGARNEGQCPYVMLQSASAMYSIAPVRVAHHTREKRNSQVLSVMIRSSDCTNGRLEIVLMYRCGKPMAGLFVIASTCFVSRLLQRLSARGRA